MTARSGPSPAGTIRTVGSLVRRLWTPRALALLAGTTLIATFLDVFYHLVDVVGGVAWLVAAVAAAFLLSTAFARREEPREQIGRAHV